MDRFKPVLIIVIVIASTEPASSQNKGVRELNDFTKHVSNGQSVYHFYNKTCCTFDEANSTCNKFGGFLAHVKTQQVWQFIKDNIDERTSGGYFIHMLWIGLQQVGEDNNLWEWSDGTPLEGGRNNSNWYKGDTDEPNNYRGDEKCVSVATMDWREVPISDSECGVQPNTAITDNGRTCIYSKRLGQWCDIRCENNNRFICENVFGSGFVSTSTVSVRSSQESVTCTVFGDSSYSATWYRNGKAISVETNKPIYQKFDENSEYRTSTINFVNPNESDEGSYTCSLVNSNTGTSNNLSVQLQITNFLAIPRIISSNMHGIWGANNLTCLAIGRPIPTIMWKLGDVVLERNDKIFQVSHTINEKTLTAKSMFSIINPFSFEGKLSCVAKGANLERTSTAFVNIDTPKDKNFQATDLIEMDEDESVCEGTELSVEMRDFTSSATSYSLTVTKNGNDRVFERYARESLSGKTIKVSQLQPLTNYSFTLVYQPQFWTTKVVNFTKMFRTKQLTIPESMKIIGAVDWGDECKVNFDPPKNINLSQLLNIKVKITEVNENEEPTSRTEIIPYQRKNWFSIETGNRQSTYNFTTRLITCGGKIGGESETHQCVRGQSIIIWIGIGAGIFVIIIVVIVAGVLISRKRKLDCETDADDTKGENNRAFHPPPSHPDGAYITLDVNNQAQGEYATIPDGNVQMPPLHPDGAYVTLDDNNHVGGEYATIAPSATQRFDVGKAHASYSNTQQKVYVNVPENSRITASTSR